MTGAVVTCHGLVIGCGFVAAFLRTEDIDPASVPRSRPLPSPRVPSPYPPPPFRVAARTGPSPDGPAAVRAVRRAAGGRSAVGGAEVDSD